MRRLLRAPAARLAVAVTPARFTGGCSRSLRAHGGSSPGRSPRASSVPSPSSCSPRRSRRSSPAPAFGDGAPTAAFVVLGAAFAVRAATSAATEWLGRAAASQALAALRRRVGEHVLAARAPRVEDARRGELATAAVHGVDALGEYYAKAVPQLALAAVVPPALVAVVLWHDPVVGVLLALTIPLVVVFMVLVGRESAERIAERRVALGVLGTHFLDVVRGLPTLRAHGRAEAQAETLGADRRALPARVRGGAARRVPVARSCWSCWRWSGPRSPRRSWASSSPRAR